MNKNSICLGKKGYELSLSCYLKFYYLVLQKIFEGCLELGFKVLLNLLVI